jgi:glycosyltransferase involved in cell wall biosynthesis
MPDLVGLAWELTSVTGWGVYGTNLTLELLRRGRPRPVLLKRPAQLDLDPLRMGLLAPLVRQQEQLLAQLKSGGKLQPGTLEFPVIKTLTSALEPMTAGKWFFGKPDVGVVFFENTHVAPQTIARGRRFGRVVCGSTWNGDLLQSRGLDNVAVVLQGVDTSLFHPAVRHKLLADRFVVFSGGKLEHRKGQDLVLTAFKRFHARHPEALLLTAWHSPWPDKARDLAQSPHVTGAPPVRGGRCDVAGWAAANGLPPGAVIDVGLVPNDRVPRILGQCDCAVFPSRYESGTNLPAMEAMACGLPVVLSDNTGHKDIIADDRCYRLQRQGPVAAVPSGWGAEGWGESEVDEIDASLEAIYADSAEANRRGAAAAEFAATLSWPTQVDRLVQVVADAVETR